MKERFQEKKKSCSRRHPGADTGTEPGADAQGGEGTEQQALRVI